jgi:hypothetical protein
VKHLLKSHENISVKKIPYSAKCRVHIIVFEVPEKVVADPPRAEKMRLENRACLG